MKRFPGFIGGSYLAASVNAACQRSQNLFPEAIEADGETKSVGMLRARPGIGAPFITLPTSPIRGLFAGGAPLTTGGRLFAVAGSKLYEVFSGGTSSLLGDVGDDAAHSPVQMIPNGNQLGIVSAGKFYLADGITVAQPLFISAHGVVDTSGTAVTWDEGDNFTAAMAGQQIIINGVGYTVASVTDNQHLVLTSSAGTQTAVAYTVFAVGGTADVTGTAVTWDSGPLFTQDLVGQTIVINGASYTVASVQDQTHLTLTGSAGAQAGSAWSVAGLGVTAQTGTFLDSYFIVAKPDSKEIDFSGVFDGKTWDPLDFGIKEGYPDNIGAILADHEDLWILGESSSEIWRSLDNPPAEGAPMQRDPGAFIPIGLASIRAANSTRQGPIWLGTDLEGGIVAYRGQGYQPQRVSTHAVEQVWSGYSTVQDAESFMLELDGHEFWVLSFATADATWVYDITASNQFGKPLWHEWTYSTDGVTFHRHPARGHAFVSWANAAGVHYVGDHSSGAIYPLSTATYQDNGQTIYCVRTFPHLSEAGLRQFFHRLQLDLETGGAALTVKLDWSKDNGHTFSNAMTVTVPQLDSGSNPNFRPQARAIFNRLGSGRDRVFRVTVTGNTKISLINAYLDWLAGGA